MSHTDRREFLRDTVSAGAVGAASLSLASLSQAAGSEKEVSVGLIGCGGRGTYLAGVFRSNPGVKLTWICDADRNRFPKGGSILGDKPKLTGDIREMLKDDSLDAVIVATPDHWHSPAAILACDAGKHVYVEKPCSHSIREGRLLVEAARRNLSLIHI